MLYFRIVIIFSSTKMNVCFRNYIHFNKFYLSTKKRNPSNPSNHLFQSNFKQSYLEKGHNYRYQIKYRKNIDFRTELF